MGYDSTISPTYQQAYAAIPSQQAAPQQQVQFAGGEAVQKEESSIFPKLLFGAAAVTAAVAGHKTIKMNGAFSEAIEKGIVAKDAVKPKNLFLKNCNPLNWFGNSTAVEALEKANYKKLGESGHFFQNEAGDTFTRVGKKLYDSKGEFSEDASKVFSKVDDAPKAADTPKTKVKLSPEEKTDYKKRLKNILDEGHSAEELTAIKARELASCKEADKEKLTLLYDKAIDRTNFKKTKATIKGFEKVNDTQKPTVAKEFEPRVSENATSLEDLAAQEETIVKFNEPTVTKNIRKLSEQQVKSLEEKKLNIEYLQSVGQATEKQKTELAKIESKLDADYALKNSNPKKQSPVANPPKIRSLSDQQIKSLEEKKLNIEYLQSVGQATEKQKTELAEIESKLDADYALKNSNPKK